MLIRPALPHDAAAIAAIILPVIRAGETYALDRAMSEEAATAYWLADDKTVFVAEQDGAILGTYYLRANQAGGGDHVANAGYMTSPAARGRGVARAMALHSFDQARAQGFAAMQFNFVVAATRPRCICGRRWASRRSGGCRGRSGTRAWGRSMRW